MSQGIRNFASIVRARVSQHSLRIRDLRLGSIVIMACPFRKAGERIEKACTNHAIPMLYRFLLRCKKDLLFRERTCTAHALAPGRHEETRIARNDVDNGRDGNGIRVLNRDVDAEAEAASKTRCLSRLQGNVFAKRKHKRPTRELDRTLKDARCRVARTDVANALPLDLWKFETIGTRNLPQAGLCNR
jgi:hypothetical protein